MMVIRAVGTGTIAEDTSPTNTFQGIVGQTTYEIQGSVAEAFLHGQTINPASATIGGTPVTPASSITFDPETRLVTIPGLARDATTETQVNGAGNIIPAGTTIIPITNLDILDAISANQTLTITAIAVTDTGGVTRNLNPANDVSIVGTDFVLASPEDVPTNFAYSITVSIPAYTTNGIPITRRGSTAGRRVVITFDTIPLYHSEIEQIHPADRCTWNQEPSITGNGYHIVHAIFYNGADSTGDDLNNPVLGYIGKSGRFVAITEER